MAGRKFREFTDEQRRAAVVDEPVAMALPGGVFGPWQPGIEEVERRAGLRALAALCVVFAGSMNQSVAALRRAERRPAEMKQALDVFDRLPTLQRRLVISAYFRLMRPLQQGGAPCHRSPI